MEKTAAQLKSETTVTIVFFSIKICLFDRKRNVKLHIVVRNIVFNAFAHTVTTDGQTDSPNNRDFGK